MSAKLRDALANDQLYIALQPVVDLVNRRVYANEALLRSRTPELKSPLQIIESAIAHDFMGTLGRALRDMAVHSCPQTPLFLNINPAEFDEGWLVRPDDPIFRHEHDVYLEITESVPLSHFRHCHTVLKEIRSKGVFLAVDDLGAGYSNLKYIADLAPEIVKLDRELVAGLHREPRMFRLVRSIVRLCDDMGAKVVAEGIETIEELKAVVDSGTHFGQGFLLARPAFPVPEVNWAALDQVMRPAPAPPMPTMPPRTGTGGNTPVPRFARAQTQRPVQPGAAVIPSAGAANVATPAPASAVNGVEPGSTGTPSANGAGTPSANGAGTPSANGAGTPSAGEGGPGSE